MHHQAFQKPPCFHHSLCLFTSEQSTDLKKQNQVNKSDWEGANSHQSISKSKTSKESIGLQPWICREVKTLSSLESNCESETSDDEMIVGEETKEMEVADDYISFCNDLTRSPARDAASSRLFCTSVCSTSLNLSIDTDDDDEDDKICEIENENDGGSSVDNLQFNGDEFECLGFTSRMFCVSSSRQFDPFSISGLFLPSIISPSIFDMQSSLVSDELSQKLKEVNKRWQEESCQQCHNEGAVRHVKQNSGRKTVCFSSEVIFIDVLNKIEWADDYEAARKGPWEQLHRDHLRFAKRIESASELLSPILDSKHRSDVFRNRYGNDNYVPCPDGSRDDFTGSCFKATTCS